MSSRKGLFSGLSQAQAVVVGATITAIGGIISGAILLVFGGIVTGYFDIRKTTIPIEATETAEAKLTEIAIAFTPTPILTIAALLDVPTSTSTSTPIPTHTLTLTPTDTPTLTPTDTLTPISTGTPTQTPMSTPTDTSTPTPTAPTTATSLSFNASPESINEGDCTIFNWNVQGVKEVYFDGKGVPGVASQRECPKKSKVYVLRVIHIDYSEESLQIPINVNPDTNSSSASSTSPDNTPTPYIRITYPNGSIQCNNSQEVWCEFTMSGISQGVTDDALIYPFVHPTNPPGNGWYRQEQAILKENGDWSQGNSILGSSDYPVTNGDTLDIRVVIVKSNATINGSKVSGLQPSQAIERLEDIDGRIAFSDPVNLVVIK